MPDDIPPEILTEIKRVAREEWPGDREMQQYTVDAETTAYRALEDLDYGEAADHKPAILTEAKEYHTTWEEIYGFVSEEVEAFKALAALAPDDVPSDFIAEHKREAAAEHDWFAMQLETVEQAIEGYRYVQRTRAKVGPIRDILVRMEAIIGSECFNANIQTTAPGASGRAKDAHSDTLSPTSATARRRSASRASMISRPEALITGHYKFGANELSIHRALVRIVDMLKTDYGLTISAPEDPA